MNETNELEKQLRSWEPRRPSRRLEERLFGAQGIPQTEHGRGHDRDREVVVPGFRLSWLAPSGIALVLVCLLFNQRFNPTVRTGAIATPVVAMISSNQALSALTRLGTGAGDTFNQRKQVINDGFEFTNGSGIMSANIISTRLIATNL